jgi:hypothetical protein
MLSDSRCKDYYNNNLNDSYVIGQTAKYCNNINKTGCKEFCQKNPGQCDVAAAEYCKYALSDPFCKCINSPANQYDAGSATCVDKDCINNASYRTATMKQISQCSVVNCNVIWNLEAGGNFNIADNDFVQNCRNEQTTGGGNTGGGDTGGGNTGGGNTGGGNTGGTTTTTFIEDNKDIIIYSSVGILIFIFIIVMVIIMGSSSKVRQSMTGMRRSMPKFRRNR